MSSETQKKFLKNMFFGASWRAATGHHNVWREEYKGDKAADIRAAFRCKLQEAAEEILEKQYNGEPPSSAQHSQNIQRLKEFSKTVEITKDGMTVTIKNELNIGTVQKLFNLLCKYYWCAGWIQVPPHLPIDRIILCKIKHKQKWTELDCIKEYEKIIETCKEKSKEKEAPSLAQWELEVWNDAIERQHQVCIGE